MTSKRGLFSLVLAIMYFFPGILAGAQNYTSIVVFGDSLSDTGNDATVSKAAYGISAQVPGPGTGYTDGRFTDGYDTIPAARNYTGVWIEQLAAMLGTHPVILNSLAGGKNYAYGFATTSTGTTTFTYGPGNALSFNVNNMGQQVSTYLATNPTINSQTLFVVWGGANDLIAATSPQDIQNAAMRDAGIIQALINAGATDFIVPNLPPLGLVPRFNGSAATSTPATQAAAGYDQALAAYLGALPAANPGKTLHIYSLDTYTLFNTLVAAPSAKGFANVTASSQGNSSINPDTYLFWDDLHPTTYGHSLLAASAYALIGTPVVTSATVTSSSLNANLKASVTFTASVADTSGTPMGTVTFLDGTTVLSSSVVTGSGTTATATYTTSSLAAGTHTITAQFAGVNGYVSSTSAGISEVVTAPALTTAFSPSSLTVLSGNSASVALLLNPVGGYSGTATIACGSLPAHLSCTVTPVSISLAGDNKQQMATITIGTSMMAAMHPVARPGASSLPSAYLAFAFFPCIGLLEWKRRSRRNGNGKPMPWLLLAALAVGCTLGTTGCAHSANNNNAPSGTYTVPIAVTANGTTSTNSLTVVVQ